jgi:hypothetical protein
MWNQVRAAAPLALAVVAAALPASASASDAPPAHAAGGDAPAALIYPSIVRTRVSRTQHALKTATKQIDNGDYAAAAKALKTVRRQLSSAWRGAKYVIRTTPPPPAAEASVRAHQSGGAPVGPAYAAPADTGVRVLTLQDDVASAMIELIDGAHGTGLTALGTTLNFALDRRDAALQDIKTLAPPAPPAEDARVRAHVSGGAPVVTTFDTVMPNVVPQLDDELQAIEGLKSDATDLTAGGRKLLADASAQITKTKAFVNTTWPPVPAEA